MAKKNVHWDAVQIVLALLMTWAIVWQACLHACSPAGHAFVAVASVGKLARSEDPQAQRLARILQKYRWVVCWGAEGPDTVQRMRGYHNSHWFPLYPVDYHHPERFDLWERFLAEYGVPANTADELQRSASSYHVDNGVLPYCALAGSRGFYSDWPPKVLEHVDASKYDFCAAPMMPSRGAKAVRWVEHERGRVLGMMEHMGLSLDEAIRQSDAQTGWRKTYAQVIDMIVRILSQAAGEMSLRQPDDVDVVAAARTDSKSAEGKPIVIPAEPGSVDLAFECDRAIRRYRTQKGEVGPVTGWGAKPSGARFEPHVFLINGKKEFGIVTDGPWLGGHRPGCVSGSFRLRLPAGGPPITLRARVCMWGKSQRSDGVTFRVEVVDGKGKRHVFFDRHTHSHEPIPVSVRLSPFAGQEIRLSLVSDCGPNDNCRWDWGAWLSPRVVVGKREQNAKRGNVGTR